VEQMNRKKNILILSTSHPYKTSGVVAYDIFKGFKDNGYTVKLVVKNYDQYEEGITSVQNGYEVIFKKIKKKLRRLFFRIFNFKDTKDTIFKYHFDNVNLTNESYSTKRILSKAGIKPDVVVVIFSQNFISYKNLKEIYELTKAPVIWQFADMFPFTGGCHYAWDCNGYMKLCENCPAIASKKNGRRPDKVMLKKIDYIKNIDITSVIGSDWLIERATKSTLFKNKPIKKIYLSIDSGTFRPFIEDKKSIIRDKYNISQNDFVILILATHLSHKRKGIDLILRAFSKISKEYIINNHYHIMIVGKEFEKIQDMIPSYLPYSHIEGVEREKLPEIYNMSNLFVSASLQEVGPYTLIEALLCCVPVVSLDHGYAREFVINYKTGILVKDDLPQSIAKGIKEMTDIHKDELFKIKNNCRERTKDMVSNNKQIQQYIELINNLNYEIG